jgi:hypothetical protein
MDGSFRSCQKRVGSKLQQDEISSTAVDPAAGFHVIACAKVAYRIDASPAPARLLPKTGGGEGACGRVSSGLDSNSQRKQA